MGSFDKAPLTAELRRGSAVGGYGHIAELEVRIQFPPADSPGLAQTGPLQVENRGFHAGVRRWVGGAVGREAQALVRRPEPALISLSNHIPVPQCC